MLDTKIEKLEAYRRDDTRYNTNNRDISEQLEIIMKRKQLRPQKVTNYVEQEQPSQQLKPKVILLENIESSRCAMYQTVKEGAAGGGGPMTVTTKVNGDGDSIKKQLIEINNHAIRRQMMGNLDENGRLVEEEPLESEVFECDSCQYRSTTEKMLKLHETTKHDPETTFFKCPSCSKRFLQVSTVMKHLSSEHK